MRRFRPVSRSIVLALTGAISAAAFAADVPWRTGSVDILQQNAAAELAALATRPDQRHVVLQFHAPLSNTQREQLAAGGVQLLAYVSGNAYFATVEADADISATASLLAGASAIDANWKLHPMLARNEVPTWAVVADGADPVIGAYVLFHTDVDMKLEGSTAVAAHNGFTRSTLRSVNGMVIEAPMSDLIAMANEDAVQWIEPALPKLVELNSENRALTGANTMQDAPYSLDGTGVTAMIFDGGSALASHQDFGGRLTVRDASSLSSHATHVSGTVGGNGSASGGVNRGMAPNVTLLSYGFSAAGGGTFLYTDPGDIEANYTDGINNGADITNNSIGTNTETNGFSCTIQGDYGVTDAVIDSVVRGSLSGGVPYRIVWAAGNERQGSRCDVEGFGDYYSSAPPAGAKNHLCIGAINANDDSMTSFSSWGPTDDGRLKPDFVSTGCQSGGDGGVTSTTSTSTTGYTIFCGTSMACPTVTGLASLLLQDYRAHFIGNDPRNSTLKVLFAHNAIDLGSVGPDYVFGYGSVRIQPTIEHMRSGLFEEQEVGTGEAVSYVVNVPPGATSLKLTLAWDDAPATPNALPALVNNLDLRVFSPGAVQAFPWTLDPANPSVAAVRTQADNRNNLEQVVVDNPAAGEWIVEIAGTNVPVGPQPYSLAASHTFVERGIRIRLPGGVPNVMTPGVGVTLPVEVIAGSESIVPGSVQMHVRYAGASFISIPLAHLGGINYEAVLPPAVCGSNPEFYFTAEGSVSGQVSNPASGATSPFNADVSVTETNFADDMEIDAGWVGGQPGDNATTGVWTRVNPIGTVAQPEDDHTSGAGITCWVTGQGSLGGSSGENDVDGGRTTLLSPAFDATGLSDGTLSYWRWYSNSSGASPNADVFTVEISNNNGANWVNVEVVGPTGPGTSGGWNLVEVDIDALLTPTNQMRVRFIAEDAGSGSIIEAAIDDVTVSGIGCDVVLADCNGNGIVDADDIASGRATDSNGNNVPDSCDPPAGCVGDVNDDNVIDLIDLSQLLAAFGTSVGNPAFNAGADFDTNGSIDLSDLASLLAVFGGNCP